MPWPDRGPLSDPAERAWLRRPRHPIPDLHEHVRDDAVHHFDVGPHGLALVFTPELAHQHVRNFARPPNTIHDAVEILFVTAQGRPADLINAHGPQVPGDGIQCLP
jgi:hypothetical protein